MKMDKKIQRLLRELATSEQRLQREKEAKVAIANQLAIASHKLAPEVRADVLKQMAELLAVDEMSERVTRLLSQSKEPLVNVASFKQLMVQATRRRQLFNFQPEWKLNNKRVAYKFVDEMEIRRPSTYEFNQPLDDISIRARSVLKPENGSSSLGVFVFDEQGGAFEVSSGTYLETQELALQKARTLLQKGTIKKDAWLLEEFIGDFANGKPLPPIDLKFYCFYGEVGFVLEVERASETRYCEWLSDGTLAETGRYAEKKFIGQGFTPSQIALAQQVSEQVPTPFVRIDFIKSQNIFAFGEFTPRPGQFSSFNKAFDRYLGELYLKAEARLLKKSLGK